MDTEPFHLLFEKVYESLPATGWLSKNEARVLFYHALYTPGNILEVGCYHGRSTVLLASAAHSRGSIVCSVDPWEGFTTDYTTEQLKTTFRNNLFSRQIFNVVSHPVKIEDFTYPNYVMDGNLGLAYLDGDHTPEGTKNQINAALKCLAKVIAIHDVNDSGEGALIKRQALSMLGPWVEREERLAVWIVSA